MQTEAKRTPDDSFDKLDFANLFCTRSVGKGYGLSVTVTVGAKSVSADLLRLQILFCPKIGNCIGNAVALPYECMFCNPFANSS